MLPEYFAYFHCAIFCAVRKPNKAKYAKNACKYCAGDKQLPNMAKKALCTPSIFAPM